MKATTFFIPVILFLFSGSNFAQSPAGYSSIEGFQVQSTILNEERNINIYLPNDYASSNNRYPVLYLLDGRTHFQHATGAVNFLSNQGSVPNMIIVSVHNVDRNRDFSPVYDDRIPTSGGAEKFLGFMSDELITYLDGHYRTSGFDILMGHSFGGTFAVYSLITKPEVFDAYIAVSPYLQFADNYLVKRAGEALTPNSAGMKYFFMTVGNEPDYFDALAEFSSTLKEKSEGTVDLSYVKMESENHATIPYNSVFNGLRFIFSDWQLPGEKFDQGLVAVDAHYAKVSSKYGFKMQAPENTINALGYTYLQNNEIEKAIPVFTENVERYPSSANVYDSLGEAYERNSQFKKAKKNYQKAYDLGKQQNDVNVAVYRKNLERMQQQ